MLRRCGLLSQQHWNECGGLRLGTILATLLRMSVPVNLPDELAAQIDHITRDRTRFVAEAVRRLLHESGRRPAEDETARINQFADELNREAEDVLEYQVIL